MRDYIILNGVNSNTITGLLISTLPPITKPKQRTTVEEIDGRDGDIVTKLGYSAYDKEIQIGLYGDFDIDDVMTFFNGEGTVTFSNEEDKYYNYQILDQIDYEKLIRFKTAKVKMHVQPFKYPLEETPVEITIQNVTGSEENIDLDNTAEAPVTLALNGNTSQDGTPTPTTPVEVDTTTGGQNIIIESKNLFNGGASITTNGITFTKNSDGSYNIIGTATANANCDNYIFTTGIRNGQTYTMWASQSLPSGFSILAEAYNGSTWLRQILGGVSLPRTNTANITGSDRIRYRLAVTNGTTINITNLKIQLEKGSEATSYEPYQNQSYDINLGKNIFDINNIDMVEANGATLTKENNKLIINNSTNQYGSIRIYLKDLGLKPNTTYTFSAEVEETTSSVGSRVYCSSISTYGNYAKAGEKSILTFTTNSTIGTDVYLGLYPSQANVTTTFIAIQLEKGDTASSFAPYKAPIEVCKIGDYQDIIYKDNGKWYLYKTIGKVVLNGSEDWLFNSSSSVKYRFNLVDSINLINGSQDNAPLVFTNRYQPFAWNNASSYTYGATSNQSTYICFKNNDITTLEAWKTELSTNNIIVYYPLATPTTTEITDQELITQLEAINNARSYDLITHITQNTADKPFIINATAVQKGTDTGVVDNEGNIYSKPTIDIEGTGTAEIYLNNNQIFSVDLSTYNECIIDTTNLEAYNPATSQLMNRQVTGDYSNFKLNAGENQIKISGAVTKATITNYTRWL